VGFAGQVGAAAVALGWGHAQLDDGIEQLHLNPLGSRKNPGSRWVSRRKVDRSVAPELMEKERCALRAGDASRSTVLSAMSGVASVSRVAWRRVLLPR
jgi:hypothetical protein